MYSFKLSQIRAKRYQCYLLVWRQPTISVILLVICVGGGQVVELDDAQISEVVYGQT